METLRQPTGAAREDSNTCLARRQSDFLVDLSDELRAPLDGLLTLARLLAEAGNLTTQQVDFAQTIYAAGSDLLSLSDEILAFARTEGGAAAMEPAEQSFGDLRAYLLRAFRHAVRERRIAFEVVIAAGLPAFIRTDGSRLRHLLKSLVSHAFKAAGGGVVLAVAPAGSDVVFELTVRDPRDTPNGKDPRHMGDDASRGLPICRELARSLGGRVERVGQGNGDLRIRLTLPMDLPPEFEAPAAEASAAQAGYEGRADPGAAADAGAEGNRHRRRSVDDPVVLIVEGNQQVASIMLDLVRANGYRAVVAADVGTMGVLLREIEPEAVLIGGSLLDIDGWSALELVKREARVGRVPVALNCIDAGRYLCLQMDGGSLRHGMEAMLSALDTVAGRKANAILAAGFTNDAPELAQARRDGRRVSIATTGAQALAILGEEDIDALVLGPPLGDMTAIALIRAIGAAGLGREVLALAMTGGRSAHMPETGMLRRCASLEDVLGHIALHLARNLGHRTAAVRKAGSCCAHRELDGRKVLIVDDDIYNVYAMTGALEQQGMTVMLAESGTEAVETLRAHPDLSAALVAVATRGDEGTQVVRAMRVVRPSLPVVAVTSGTLPGDRETCLAAGASDCLSKPLDVEQMLSLLRAWLVCRQETA